MPNVTLAGFLHDSAGLAVSGATVNTFKRNDTGTALSTATTNASGYWSITETTADAAWLDIQITNGTEITRFKYDDQAQLTQLDLQTLVQRNSSGVSSYGITFNPTTLTADRTITWPDDSGTVALVDQFRNDSQMVWGAAVTKYKTADQSFTSSVLTNDTHLQVALASAAFYEVEATVIFTQSGSSGDLIAKWSVPTGANMTGIWLDGPAIITEASSQTIGPASSVALDVQTFHGFVQSSATAGTLLPQWRQDNADASATTILTGSWMRVKRISS